MPEISIANVMTGFTLAWLPRAPNTIGIQKKIAVLPVENPGGRKGSPTIAGYINDWFSNLTVPLRKNFPEGYFLCLEGRDKYHPGVRLL